jgi:hypothetical protein
MQEEPQPRPSVGLTWFAVVNGCCALAVAAALYPSQYTSDFSLLVIVAMPAVFVFLNCYGLGLRTGRRVLGTVVGLVLGGIAGFLSVMWCVQAMLRAWK